ncbi:MAG: DUF4295 domain-containing protein [Flavobacteriales bacterium AspAUS03]
MAKKTVATLQTDASKKMTKIIRMIRSTKSGAYIFEEKMINSEKVDEFFSKK